MSGGPCRTPGGLRGQSIMLRRTADALDPAQVRAYFALTETVSLLQHAVRQQLQAEGGLSYVQFETLAKLADADRPLTMTDLADGAV